MSEIGHLELIVEIGHISVDSHLTGRARGLESQRSTNKFWIVFAVVVLGAMIVLGWYNMFNPSEEDEPEPELVVTPKKLTPINPYQQRLADEFEQYLDSLRLEKDIPAVAACILHKGEPILITALGHKVNHTNDLVNTDTKFRLASVSKGFTSILVALLARDSLISWDQHVNEFLTDFHPEPLTYSDSMTVRHLISQTSGFPYQAYSNLIEDGWTLPEMIEALSQLQVVSKPGRLYSYQNVAYSLIEPILAQQTSQQFPSLLQEYIFDPLNMSDASASYEDMSTSPNAAMPHRRSRYSYVPIRLSEAYYNTMAAGGINASISDMSEWLRLLTMHRPDVIDSATLQEVFQPRVRTRLLNRYYRTWLGARRAYYGLGWRIVPMKSDTIVYHGGYANGYKSHIAIDHESDVAVCILSNSSDNLVNQAGPYFFNLFYKYEEQINAWGD